MFVVIHKYTDGSIMCMNFVGSDEFLGYEIDDYSQFEDWGSSDVYLSKNDDACTDPFISIDDVVDLYCEFKYTVSASKPSAPVDAMDATTIDEVKQQIVKSYISYMDLWHTFAVDRKDEFGDQFHTLANGLEFLYRDLFPNDETSLYDNWLDTL